MRLPVRKLLLFASTLAFAVRFPLPAIAEQLPIKTYTTADGLARDQINRIVRDSRGYLWFCTREGLSRFDGYAFTTYTTDQGLPSRSVYDLLETRDGAYWVATANGLCRFNPQGTPSRFDPQIDSHSEAALGRMFITYRAEEELVRHIGNLLEDKAGSIWCGTPVGLYRFELGASPTKFQFVDIGMPHESSDDRFVEALMEDRRGAIWVATRGSGLYRRWSNGRAERYTMQQGLPSNGVKSLLEDRDGCVWAGTTKGLCQLVPDPAPHRVVVTHVYPFQSVPGWAFSLYQSSDGRFWVGGADGLNELVSTGKGNRHYRSFTTLNGLSDKSITTLAEDRDGNLWVGTDNGGAMRIARNGFTTFTTADGISQTGVDSIFENQAGEVCIISGSKDRVVSRFDGKSFSTVQPDFPAGIKYYGWGWNQIGFQDRRGEWWFGTGQGLCRFPKVTSFAKLESTRARAVYTTRDGLSGDNIFRVFEDSHGGIWISTASPIRNGISRWDPETETLHTYTESEGYEQARMGAPMAFSEDATGRVWVGGSSGLARFADGHLIYVPEADELSFGSVRALYRSRRGQLWIASSKGGLIGLEDPNAEKARFISYGTGNGLSSNDVWSIVEDDLGRVYAGTGRGVDRVDPATGNIKHYTTADGLIRGVIITALRDRSGALWFGNGFGVSRLIPESDQPPLPPPVVINGLRIAGERYPLSDLGETEVEGLTLGPNENNVQIQFVGLRFGIGEVLRYRYILKGADRDWSPVSDQRTVNFANLSPGDYEFLVQAVNDEGVATQLPARITFRILPPIWMRWWFLMLAGAVVVMAAYAIYRYRVARIIELERVRTRIASDLHDDIGSNLSVIVGVSDGLRRRAGATILATNYELSLIAAVSQRSLEAISDIVWAVNPKKDHLQDLTRRMRLFADEAFFTHNIELEFSAGASSDARVGAETRREVFLIFKEAVNNIIRHSGCSVAEVHLSLDHRTLVLKVSDNGGGFDPEQVRAGDGLASMKRRAKKIGAAIQVVSKPGEGATLRLRAPLN